MLYTTLPLLLVLSGCQTIRGLHLTDISVPEVADFRDTITLSCSYNMGTHTLNSVKWYKDDMEFFRFAPMMHPPIRTFPVNGVHLLEQTYACNHLTCSISLEQLGIYTSGAYRCEISGDAPEFKLVSQTANTTIAVLPRRDPDINGIASSYAVGDTVLANCTSDKSTLPTSLNWYINDEKVSMGYLQSPRETTMQSDDFLLRYQSLMLHFNIAKHMLRHGKRLSIKCIAVFDRFPSLNRQRVQEIQIISTDEVANQKLVNWKNTASSIQTPSMWLLIFLIAVKENLMSNCVWISRKDTTRNC